MTAGGSTLRSSTQRLSRVHDSPRLRFAGALQTYFEATPRPLYSLAAIFPLVLLFELGTLATGSPPVMRTLVAQRIVADLFAWLGTSGTWPAGFLMIAALLGWQLHERHAWRLKPWVLLGMLVESIVLTLPLFVLHWVLLQAADSGESLALRERLLQTLGAALYEELVFRLILLGGAIWLLSSFVGRKAGAAQTFLIVLVGAVFSLCHFTPVGGEAFDWTRFLHRAAAGSYLGWVFLRRGLALSVGCHVLHNAALLVFSHA